MARDKTPTQIGPDGAVPRGVRLAGPNNRPYFDPDGCQPELEAIGAIFAAALRVELRHSPDMLFWTDSVARASKPAADMLATRLDTILRDAAKAEIEAAQAIAGAAVKAAGSAS